MISGPSFDVLKPLQVGGVISELRIHHGPGYRLYFLRDGATVVLPCEGDKDSQQRDIERARRVATNWR